MLQAQLMAVLLSLVSRCPSPGLGEEPSLVYRGVTSCSMYLLIVNVIIIWWEEKKANLSLAF